MKIKNLTPHPLKIQRLDGSFLELPKPEGNFPLPRVAMTHKELPSVEGIAVSQTSFGEVENLPTQEDGVILIVSRMVLEAAGSREDLFSPGELLRDGEGVIIGAKGLSR